MAWNNFGNPYMPTIPGQYNPAGYMQGINQQSTQMPQFGSTMPVQQPINGLTRVTGMDGAKAYQMPPNSVVALFDGNDDIFYIKTSDGAGFSTIKQFRFFPLEDQVQQPQISTTDFATKQELQNLQQEIEQVKEMLSNGKQSVQEQPATANESRSRSR